MSIENSQDSETADTSKFCELLKEWFIAFFLLLQAQCHVPDRVMDTIFKLMKTFFTVLGRISAPCALIGRLLPASFYLAQKFFIVHMPKLPRFTKYPVCKACGYVWNYDDCFEGYGAHKKPKLCSNTPPFRKR